MTLTHNTSPLKTMAFLFGFMSYIISVSPLPLIHKAGLFTILCTFVSLCAAAITRLEDI